MVASNPGVTKKTSKTTWSQSSLRLNISVPQIYEDQRLKNYVSPEFWDKGIYCAQSGLDGQRLEQPHLFGRRLG
ncbi:Fimbriae usher protein StcC [Klebsiella aerogenes]|nr:Fimbriae usher protein StcC [Klebsiella aerogenes]